MPIENLAQYFGTIEDPRCCGKVEHRLLDVVVIACAEDRDDIALYDRSKLAWLVSGRFLPNSLKMDRWQCSCRPSRRTCSSR